MVDKRGARVGATRLDTLVPYSVHLSPTEQSGLSAPGPLARGPLVGGDGELGRTDTSAVPTPIDKTMSPRCCGVEDPYHFWARCRPDFHQPSLLQSPRTCMREGVGGARELRSG